LNNKEHWKVETLWKKTKKIWSRFSLSKGIYAPYGRQYRIDL
jgi:hypothetical protein